MSTERPSKGMLIFQCDVCFDETHEFSRADGDDVSNFQECWRTLREEGWGMHNNDHMCPDCFETFKADNANPFRRGTR